LSPIQGNPINNCDVLKFMITVEGDHCDYLPLMPKKPSYAIDDIEITASSKMHSQ
jgi:hypothetical protein